ncbi:MAG: hypothetical protein JNM93_08635 [Bacteriovoracaceae bacterium]|nr:hypothetical protein [Bacteriovoracaceae bacterium]
MKRNQEIVGILNPIEWDEKGEVKTFSIYSFDKDDIIIEKYPHKQKLKKLLNKQVQALGTIRKDKYGEMFIHLKSIREFIGPTNPSLKMKRPYYFNPWYDEFELSIPKEHIMFNELYP